MSCTRLVWYPDTGLEVLGGAGRSHVQILGYDLSAAVYKACHASFSYMHND